MGEELALFGGTFDPVHFGHLITARAVAEQCRFERITFVPAASPPHKPPARADTEHRLGMLELAIRDEGLFDICRLEIDRTGPSYTLDTLEELRRQHGPRTKIHWIIGADMLEGLPTWHRVQGVLVLAEIIVAARPPWQQRLPAILNGLTRELGTGQVERIKQAMIDTPLINISSSMIREKVANAQPITDLVPELVNTYIREHCLYR